MFGYLSLDIICSSKLTVFLELRSRKTVRFSEQVMPAVKYLSIFSRQMEAIVYIFWKWRLLFIYPGPDKIGYNLKALTQEHALQAVIKQATC